MIRVDDLNQFPAAARGGVLCVGNFDGVHLGHASMLTCGKAIASAERRPFVIMTFDPHPMVLLRPKVPRVPLMTTAQRLETLATFAPDALVVLHTTPEILKQSANDFLSATVKGIIGATHVVEGRTFTFGRGAEGDVAMLQKDGPLLGFQTTIVPTAEQVLDDCTLIPVSSSTIRWLVQHGRVSDAARCMGRPYTLRGTVVRGEQRGRGIGFPTANLEIKQLMPAPGVYGGTAVVDGVTHVAAISVGDNPTFAGATVTVEAYLLDFDGDLYGKVIDLQFRRWLREQFKYPGVAPLVRQLGRDVADVRALVNHNT